MRRLWAATGIAALTMAVGCGSPTPTGSVPAAAAADAAPETAAPAAATAPRPRAEPITAAEAVTDERGRFQFRGLALGNYRLTFGTPGEAAYTQLDGIPVNANYGANITDLRLGTSGASAPLGNDEYQPNRLPFVIRGNVVDGRGAPRAGVRVRVARQ